MIMNRIGNWNPQFFRELKGRVNPKNLAIATTLSLLGQFILWLSLNSRFPQHKPDNASPDWTTESVYCTGQYTYDGRFKCLPDGFGYWQIDWKDFWLDWATWSGVAILSLLILGGVYLLMSDLTKEQQRGTLNFIRLTPQSSESILIGKLIGVPALVYIAVILILPLQIGSVLASGLPIDTLLRFYLLTAAGCGFFYTGALLLGFLGGTAGLGCLVAGLLNFPYLALFRLMFPKKEETYWSNLQWFSFPIGKNLDVLQIFIFCTLTLGAFWLWQALNRRFRNPSATVFSKPQSYYAMVCWQLFLLGLTFSDQSQDLGQVVYRFSLINLIAFLVLIAALCPQRQTLLNWARYKHLETANYSVLRDLMFGEKSPILVAIGINLAITAILWLPRLIFIPIAHKHIVLVGLFAAANLIWIYAAIAQVMVLLKTRKRLVWSVIMVGAAIGLPPILITMVVGNIEQSSGLWVFSVFGVGLLESTQLVLSLSSILFGFLGQVCTMSALTWQLNRILQKAGTSETQRLLQEHQS